MPTKTNNKTSFSKKADAIFEDFKRVSSSNSLVSKAANVAIATTLAAGLMVGDASASDDISTNADLEHFDTPHSQQVVQKATSPAPQPSQDQGAVVPEKNSFADKADGVYEKFKGVTNHVITRSVGQAAILSSPLATPAALSDAAQGRVEPKKAAGSILTATAVKQVIAGGAAIGSGTVLVAGAAYGVAVVGKWLHGKRQDKKDRLAEQTEQLTEAEAPQIQESVKGTSAFDAFYASEGYGEIERNELQVSNINKTQTQILRL